ncbi:MAG: enoyl-CoA hydratase [Pseudorhodoplanes sp.]
MSSVVEYELIGPVARIWHNRPAQRNAESQELLTLLDEAIRRAIDDDNVRVIVLAGRGDHFSAGHDLKEAEQRRAAFTVEERWAYEARFYFDYVMRIWDCPKPTIAQVQGACLAGAFMVANVCDLIVAADDAFFSDPVCHSMGVAGVEVLIHPWVMGLRQAKEMLFLGSRIPAADALRLGMVNKVVPRAQLESATLEMANTIAKAPAFSLMLTKRSLNRTADQQGFRTALQAHFDTHQLSHVTEAFKSAREGGLSKTIAAASKRG